MTILPNYAESDLALLAILIEERTGITFEASRRQMMADKLLPLVSEWHVGSFLELYYLLKYEQASDQKWVQVQTQLAVNETYFFREPDQIWQVVKTIVPRLRSEHPGRKVRIWHAACATGEEPYSMAIALKETGGLRHGPVEITATDFNMQALAQAQKAVFRKRSMRSISADLQERYFTLMENDRYALSDEIRSMVTFDYLNLLDEGSMSAMGSYDIILCRNAFIYFSDDAIRQVADWFYRSLNPMGYLFVAAAESLLRLNTKFELTDINGVFGYQK